MRFFLQNIAQSNPMKAMLLVFIGLASWIISLTQQCDIAVIATLCLTAINSLLIALVFYKTGKTKFPSPFVASTYWLGMSALPLLHHCWQIQLFAFGAFAIAIIIVIAIVFWHVYFKLKLLAAIISQYVQCRNITTFRQHCSIYCHHYRFCSARLQ